MITNLFSVFDPAAAFNLPFNWVRSNIFLLAIIPTFWVVRSKINKTLNLITNKLHQEFKTLLGDAAFSGSSFIFIALFMFIVFNNFFGFISLYLHGFETFNSNTNVSITPVAKIHALRVN